MLKLAGDIGFVLAGTGAIALASIFIASVRWWKDPLGWIMALLGGSIGAIMGLSMVRLIGLPLPGLFWWRAFLFNSLGIALWAGFGAFVWSQFLAPRKRARKVSSSKSPSINEVREDEIH